MEIRTVAAIDNLSVAAVGVGLQTPEGTQIFRPVLAVVSVFGLCPVVFPPGEISSAESLFSLDFEN